MLPLLHVGQSCIIVGAGISGLLAARELIAAGIRVTILEKSRGVGGRMSTRRLDHAVFDHGAQFLTSRDPVFSHQLRDWTADQLISEWSRGFPDPLDPGSHADGHPRYFVRGGMTALPKHLAGGLEIHTNARVAEVALDGHWKVRLDGSSERLTGDALILTAPVPQSLDLLDLGGVELPESAHAALLSIRYHPCLTWMALPTSDRRLPPPGAIQFSDGPLQFLADNHQKGISPDAAALTIHTSQDFSRRYFDADEIETWSRIVNNVAAFTGPLRRVSFQRWRYAQPVTTHPERSLRIDLAAPLVVCGDAFGGPRIEGAALSGIAAARCLTQPGQ